MTRGTVAFHVGYGSAIGFGHLVRSSALAHRLRARGWTTVLLAEDGASVPPFSATAYSRAIPMTSAPSVLASWLVVDHPSTDEGLLKRVSGEGTRILRYVDNEEEVADADVIVNQNLGGWPRPDPRRVTLLGPRYATLRPAFARARPEARRPADRSMLRRVLVMPGATDVCRITERILPSLVDDGLSVDVVLSSVALGVDEVRRMVGARPRQARLHIDVDDHTMSALSIEADVVVGNGGVGSWERCALGVPSIIVEMAADQRNNVAALEAAGASVKAGHAADRDLPARIVRLIEELRRSPGRLADMSDRSFRICDGLGASRVAAVIDPLYIADGRTVGLRSATMEDCRLVFEWQSVPATRRYARNPAVPLWEEHERWFALKLSDHRTIFNIIEIGGMPAGVLRLDAKTARSSTPVYEVSIFVAPESKGRGIAGVALEAASRLVPFSWLQAFVMPENDTSLRLFARAGYEAEGDIFYLPPRDTPSLSQDSTT